MKVLVLVLVLMPRVLVSVLMPKVLVSVLMPRVSVLVLVLKVMGHGLGLETTLWLLNKRKAIISKPIISIYSCLSRVT